MFKQKHLLLPALVSAGSFFALILCMLLTSPVRQVSYIILFFGILMVFLLSFGTLIMKIKSAQVSLKDRYRVFIFSVLILSIIMFRSAHSLSLTDVLILVLITLGLFFYGIKRVK